MNWLFSRSPSFFGIFVECVSTYLWCWEWPHCCSVCLQCCWRRNGRLLYPPASHLSPAECPLAAECICTTEGANIPVKPRVISLSRGQPGCTAQLVYHLMSVVLSNMRFFSQVMLASGTPLISHWKRATPPSSTDMDAGWVWNFGRAGKQINHLHSWPDKKNNIAYTH